MMNELSAVILAAGAGSRFWPYNVVRNKCAFPIANVPVVRRLVKQLQALGIQQIAVVVGHGEPSVRAALHGLTPEPVIVRRPAAAGTAAAALAGAAELAGDLLILCGDLVTHQDNLAALVDHAAADSAAGALIHPLGDERPQDWLVAHREGDLLTGVEGHPRDGSHRLAGAYLLRAGQERYLRNNPGVMQRVPVGGMPPLEAEIAQSLQMMVDDGVEVVAVETRGHHVDLDKPWQILEANQRVMEEFSGTLQENVIAPGARIHDGADLHGRVVLGRDAVIGNRVVVRGDLWLGDGAVLDNGAIVEGPLVAGPGVTIKDYCQIGGHSSVGARGYYGHGAEFSGVALETVYCYHYCEIWGVVGMAVDFGAATVCGNLRFDDAATPWTVKGRREIPVHASNAAYFGDFSRTGVNAIIMPGRRTGVYSVVGPGVILHDDLPDRQMVLAKQELTFRPWGPERYGW